MFGVQYIARPGYQKRLPRIGDNQHRIETPHGAIYFAGDTGWGPHFEMIRARFLASQSRPALVDRTTVWIDAGPVAWAAEGAVLVEQVGDAHAVGVAWSAASSDGVMLQA